MAYIYVEDEPQTNLKKPSVRLTGTDGNVFALMGLCKQAMQRYHNEVDSNYNVHYMFNAMVEEIEHGDYNEALQAMMAYLDVS